MVHASNNYLFIRHLAYCIICDEKYEVLLMQYEAKRRYEFANIIKYIFIHKCAILTCKDS